MKPIALLCLCTAFAALAQNPPVQGIAVNGETGLAMPGVHVRLTAGSSDGITVLYGAISGRDGRFSVEGVVPGAYVVAGELRGYLYVPPEGARPLLDVKSGAEPVNLKLIMFRRALVMGRVLDPSGDVVPYASVQARPVRPATAGGVHRYGLFATSDERGEYWLSLPPGKWRVQANPQQHGFGGPPEVRTDGSSEAAYAATFYPSATTEAEAVAVETTPGAEIPGIDIVLAGARRLLNLSGVVTGLPPDRRGAPVQMIRGEGGRGYSLAGTEADASGKFTFSQIEPGNVWLYAWVSEADPVLYSPIVELTLDAADATNVELALAPAGDLTGKLEVLGETPEAAARAKRRVTLAPRGPLWQMTRESPEADIDKEGKFRLHNIPPSRFRIAVDPLPENGYLKAVTLDGAAAAGSVIDCSHGCHNSTVKVVISPKGATVTGTVLEQTGEPAMNVTGSVYLVRDGENVNPENISAGIMSKVDAQGRFRFKGLAPGKYRLFIEDYRIPIQWQPDTFKKLAEAAEQIEVREGDRITKDLKIGSKEAPDAR